MRITSALFVALGFALAACSTRKPAAAPAQPISNTEAPPPAPQTGLRVTGVEPSTGDVEGGTYVRFKGAGFLPDTPLSVKVYFGSRQGTVIRIASDEELIVEAPGGRANETVDVVLVFDPGGERTLPRAFTFVVKNF